MGLNCIEIDNSFGSLRIATKNLNLEIDNLYYYNFGHAKDIYKILNEKSKYINILKKDVKNLKPIHLLIAKLPECKFNEKKSESKLFTNIEKYDKYLSLLKLVEKQNPRFVLFQTKNNFLTHSKEYDAVINKMRGFGYIYQFINIYHDDIGFPENKNTILLYFSRFRKKLDFNFEYLYQKRTLEDFFEKTEIEKYFLDKKQVKEIVYFETKKNEEEFILGYYKKSKPGYFLCSNEKSPSLNSKMPELYSNFYFVKKRIRTLTPLEKAKLSGFSKEEFEKLNYKFEDYVIGKHSIDNLHPVILQSILKKIIVHL